MVIVQGNEDENCYGNRIVRLSDLDTKKIGAELFEELRNVFLEEIGEDNMTRE